MPKLTTRCPSCKVTFPVTAAQLQVAGNKVRCGLCREVFNAIEHDTSDDLLIYDDMPLIDDIASDEEPAPTSETPQPQTPDQPDADNSKLLTVPAPPLLHESELEEPEPQLLESEVQQPEQEESQQQESQQQEPLQQGALQQGAEPHGIAPQKPPTHEPDFSLAPPRRRNNRLWWWLSLVAVLALPTQYFYHHAGDIAHNPELQPWISQFCRFTGCTINLRDIDQITATSLIIQSHPTAHGALKVTLTLENHAAFRQPFPGLLLVFEDINGQAMASRTFTPESYLRGKLREIRLMPVNQPLYLELEILDPGEKAQSYSLILRPSPTELN